MDGTLVAVLLGVLQGVLEWLPVSSEAGVALAMTAVGAAADRATAFALFLHAGTAIAAVAYYRGTILDILRTLPDWRPGSAFEPPTADLSFYAVATLASGLTGVAGYVALEEVTTAIAGGLFVAAIGVLLLVTAGLLWWAESGRLAAAPPDGDGRGPLARRSHPTAVDAVLVGLLQGLAVLPGISRSGTTVSALLLRGHDGPAALEHSFVLSIPAALGAGAIAVADTGLPAISPLAAGLALAASAVVGVLTVDGLTRLARRLAFWRICLAFGLLAVAGGGLVLVA